MRALATARQLVPTVGRMTSKPTDLKPSAGARLPMLQTSVLLPAVSTVPAAGAVQVMPPGLLL